MATEWDQERIAAAFNEWLRRYIEEPEKFTREIELVREHLRQEQRGSMPTYGQGCAAYLEQLMSEENVAVDGQSPQAPAQQVT